MVEGPGKRAAPARTSTPTEVAVNLKKIVTWLIVAFVVFYVIQQPEKSAEMVRSAGHALGAAASSMSAFVGSLV
jgi:large-conductance mechanosensitive channel